MTRPSLQDATRDRVDAVAPCYVPHNQDVMPGNHDYTPDVSPSSAAAHLSGSRDRQYLFLVYGDANAASEPAGNYPQNNTSGRDSEAEDEMFLCNPNNILFPSHLHQNNEAWNKSIQIPNPKLLQADQLCEQKIKSQEGWVSFLSKRGSILVSAEVLSFLSVAVLANCSFSFVELIVKPAGLQILLFLLLPVAFILDALLYRSVGNTPGKFLLGLKVTTPNGCSLSLMQYLKRNFSIWIKGVALGLPFIQLFTMANQGSRLSKGKETSYDESMNTQVRTKPVHWIRKILFIIAFTLLIFITIVFNNVWSKIVMNSFALNPISESSFEPFEPGQPWSDVTSQDKYKTLSAASKKETAQRYFNNVVVPQIPPEKCPNLCKVTANQFAAYAGFDIKYEPRVVDSIAKPNLFDQFDRNHK